MNVLLYYLDNNDDDNDMKTTQEYKSKEKLSRIEGFRMKICKIELKYRIKFQSKLCKSFLIFNTEISLKFH